MYRRPNGFWIPKLSFNQQDVLGLIYHCNMCETTYMFLSSISQRCPICRNLIDVSDLAGIKQDFPGQL